MTRLVLVRHGETEWHRENRYAGVSDVALTRRGVAQARLLARWTMEAGIAAIWSSPLSRARLTAQECSELTSVPVQIDDRLRELDFGDGEGLTTNEMRERFPDALAGFRIDPVARHLPGGEDPALAAQRFAAALQEIADSGERGAKALVVAHGTAMRLALCLLLGLPLRGYRRLFPRIDNCSLTEVELTPEGPSLLTFNVPVPVGADLLTAERHEAAQSEHRANAEK